MYILEENKDYLSIVAYTSWICMDLYLSVYQPQAKLVLGCPFQE